jgi:hypothetical protein
MVSELSAHRIMRCRGIILEVLKAEKTISAGRPAMPVDAVVLRSILRQFGIVKSPDHMRDQLSYLQERGYVRLREENMMGVTALLVELTASGQDLMDGIRKDDTILLDD